MIRTDVSGNNERETWEKLLFFELKGMEDYEYVFKLFSC